MQLLLQIILLIVFSAFRVILFTATHTTPYHKQKCLSVRSTAPTLPDASATQDHSRQKSPSEVELNVPKCPFHTSFSHSIPPPVMQEGQYDKWMFFSHTTNFSPTLLLPAPELLLLPSQSPLPY